MNKDTYTKLSDLIDEKINMHVGIIVDHADTMENINTQRGAITALEMIQDELESIRITGKLMSEQDKAIASKADNDGFDV